MTTMLRRVTIERVSDGRWKLVRERDENGETFYVDDLIDAFATIRAAYLPNGEPRPLLVRSTGKDDGHG